MVARLILLLLFLVPGVIQAQEFQGESVSLIVDQPYYATDDLVTFHALITPAGSGPTSKYVYIDFVAPDGDVIGQQKIKALNFIAKGELRLGKSLSQGVYRLHAYTLPTRNDRTPGSTAAFSVYTFDEVATSMSDDLPLRILAVAEGGTLQVGVKSKVLYRLEGKLPESSIELIDIDGNVVTSVDPTTRVGILEVTPVEGQSYRFNILHDGTTFPAVSSRPVVHAAANAIGFTYTIHQATPEALTLEAWSGGRMLFTKNVPAQSSWEYEIEKSALPDGYIGIQLKRNDRVVSSRVMLNDYHSKNLKIDMSLNESTFAKREEVEVLVKTRDTDNVRSDMVIKVVKGRVETGLTRYAGHVYTESSSVAFQDLLIGSTYDAASAEGDPELTQRVQVPLEVGDIGFVSGYFIQGEQAIENRPERNSITFELPDLANGSETWFYAFTTFGERLGPVALEIPVHDVQLTYEAVRREPEINNEVIDYLNRARQKRTIRRVFGDVKHLEELAESKSDADLVAYPGRYEDLEGMREFVISTIPKATVRKKKGIENVVLMPSHSYNKFKDSPLYLINGYPTFDGSKVLNLKLADVERVEIINSLSGTAKFGLMGSSGVFKVFLKQDVAFSPDSLELQTTLAPGLDFSHNTSDNQVLTGTDQIRYPDFRTVLYTSEPFYSDVAGSSYFSFKTSDITGVYTIVVYGVTEGGVSFEASKVIEVTNEVP